MDTFINFLLELLYKFFVHTLWMACKHAVSSTFLDPKSRFYYLKLMEQLKTLAYNIKILVLIQVYGLLIKFGLVKPIPKEHQIKVALALAVIAIILAVIFLSKKDRKEKRALLLKL